LLDRCRACSHEPRWYFQPLLSGDPPALQFTVFNAARRLQVAAIAFSFQSLCIVACYNNNNISPYTPVRPDPSIPVALLLPKSLPAFWRPLFVLPHYSSKIVSIGNLSGPRSEIFKVSFKISPSMMPWMWHSLTSLYS
jgi:hypothetical protein